VIRQLLEAVNYLNFEGVCHRDIKPDNLRVDVTTESSSGSRAFDLKVIDFNVASKMYNLSDQASMKGGTGLKEWSAPETRHSLHYGLEIDSWAVGCILYYILTARTPFESTKSILV
jgi:serine/threonine protein kinase